jgi:hypothetical protein
MKKKPVRRMGRRSFVKILPAGLALPGLGCKRQRLSVSKEIEHTAEKLTAARLTDAGDLRPGGINRNLASYEALRQVRFPR